MIRIFLGEAAPMAKLEWSIYKGASGVKEDFGGATVSLWLIGGGDKFLVDCTAADGVIEAVIPPYLPVGVYGVKAMWVKECCCGKRTMAEVQKVFAVTNVMDDATPVVGDCVVIRVRSCAATYGYDGLSAYEMSVLKGKTRLSENEWLDMQNLVIDSMDEKIDEKMGAKFSQNFGESETMGISQKKLTDEIVPLKEKTAVLENRLVGVFGSNEDKSVNQKTLTDAINRIWAKIEDMTGEVLQGISMVVSPNYYIGEDGCTVGITANTVETNGIFERIAFYINGALLCEAENVDTFTYETEINETSVVKCVAKILGIEYERQEIVTHYSSFWLGAGASYSSIMNVAHVIPITNGMRGAYDVEVQNGQHIIVVVGESLAQGFMRADVNGVEIPFIESTVTVDGKNYRVFTSENAYVAGTYNVDING